MAEGGRGFEQSLARQRADDPASIVFRSVESFPPRQQCMATQMTRSGVSAPASFVEGYGRGSEAEYHTYRIGEERELYSISD
jgi:four helix bundle protein